MDISSHALSGSQLSPPHMKAAARRLHTNTAHNNLAFGASANAAYITHADNTLSLTRFRKEFLVEKLAHAVRHKPIVAIAHTPELSRDATAAINAELRPIGALLSQQKNVLTRLGLERANMHPLLPLVKGPTVVVAGDADAALAKALMNLPKVVPDFFVVGALLDGRLLIEHSDVKALADLPPPEVVYRDLIMRASPSGALQLPNPAAFLVSILQQRAGDVGAAAGAEPPPAGEAPSADSSVSTPVS